MVVLINGDGTRSSVALVVLLILWRLYQELSSTGGDTDQWRRYQELSSTGGDTNQWRRYKELSSTDGGTDPMETVPGAQ